VSIPLFSRPRKRNRGLAFRRPHRKGATADSQVLGNLIDDQDPGEELRRRQHDEYEVRQLALARSESASPSNDGYISGFRAHINSSSSVAVPPRAVLVWTQR
jgi:hypothetical protein